MVKTSVKNIALSNFSSESNNLLNEVLIKISSGATRTFNFDMDILVMLTPFWQY